MTARRVVTIGPSETVAGLALVGIPGIEVSDVASGAARLSTLLLEDDDFGVILADERLVSALSPAARRRLARRPVPVLVTVPAPRAPSTLNRGTGVLLDLLQRAVGYRVRLR
jgi:vacuolar-type H+-ATPase subunit F/Vma7